MNSASAAQWIAIGIQALINIGAILAAYVRFREDFTEIKALLKGDTGLVNGFHDHEARLRALEQYVWSGSLGGAVMGSRPADPGEERVRK